MKRIIFGLAFILALTIVVPAQVIQSGMNLPLSGGTLSGPLTITAINPAISIGPTPAATGDLRFSTGEKIVFRNAGNSADIGGLRLDASNNVVLGDSNTAAVFFGAAMGYGPAGTGIGTAVSQLTSRTTGVVANGGSGGITLFSAAGSATATTFTVTNNQVAAKDTIVLNQQTGTNLYELFVTAVAAGSFNITFFTTGGTATDAPIINFTVIKGQTT